MYNSKYLHHWFDDELESQEFLKSIRDIVNLNGKMTLSDLKHICKKDDEITPEDHCYIWTLELANSITATALYGSHLNGRIIVNLPQPILDTLVDASTSNNTRTKQVERDVSEAKNHGWDWRTVHALEEISLTLAMMYDKMQK